MKKKVVFVLTALVIIALPLLIFNQEPLQDVKISADPTLAAAELVTSTPVPPQKTENTPQPTPANQPVKEVAVSNPSELFQNMISGRHIRLVPDGNYDLTTVFSSVKSFEALHDLTLEGVGDKPVVLYSENVNSSVLAFTDCTNITLKNLELSHEGMNFDEHEGKLLCFYGENENITIKNCIISGEGAAGLFASGINNLSMEDTLIHVNYPAAMELGKVNNAAFNRCTFYSYQIEVRDSEGVRFDDCLFSSLEIKDRGWRLFEEPADYVVSKYVNMECENNGILVRNSLFGDSEDTELLKDNLLARLPETPCSFDITWDEITGHVVISLKAPVPPQEGQKGYQEYFEKVLSCFEGFSLPEEDMKILGFDMPPQMDMLLELGVIYTRYNKFDELLERYRNGEKVSFRETDFIHYGDMDTGLLNSANKQYLSAQQACDIFLKELPLPVSAKDYEPFFPLSGVETGTPTLIEEDGRLFYMFKDLRYGGTESFGFDGFCVDAATGSLNKYDGKQYVEVSSADKLLIADIVRHLEKNGTIISEEDWMKVQIYDQKHISVYISGKLYFRLKLSKTAEGNQLKLYEPKYQTEGDVSEAFLEPPCREDVRWDDTYDLQWKFSEETDEALYYYVDEIVGNTVLVKGHDGGTSGCHQYTYLYGLDLGTGQKIWSVDGDYMGIYCGVTDDLEKAYTVTNGNKGLDWFKLIDIDAGILWEKDVTEYSFFCTGDYTVFYLLRENDIIISVFNNENGQLQWKERFDEELSDFWHISDSDIMVFKRTYGIKAVDVKTGEELWWVHNNKQPLKKQSTPELSISPEENDSQQRAVWMEFQDDNKYVAIETGKVLDTCPLDDPENKMGKPKFQGFSVAPHYEKTAEYSTRQTSFSLHSAALDKDLWSKEGDIIDYIFDGDTLYYVSSSKIKSVNVLTGVVNWSSAFLANIDAAPLEDNHFIKPIIFDGKLFVSERGCIYAFSLETGERLYWVSDYSIRNFTEGYNVYYYHSLEVINDLLFHGSACGEFSCLKTKQ